MRKCPKCKKWELDVTVPKDSEENVEDYFFRCWNCGFECSKKEAEEKDYPSESLAIEFSKTKMGGKHDY